VNAFILAGGLSTRMGRDKALLEVAGQPLILHALTKLRTLGFQPRIAGSRPDLARFAEVIPDRCERCGPLAGIEAALNASDTDLNLFLPVDLPLLPGTFLSWMMARAEVTQALATIPYAAGRPQPLCAVYHRRLLPGLRALLDAGKYKVTSAAASAAQAALGKTDRFDVESVAATLHFGEWLAQPPLYQWFRNLNTQEDVGSGQV
jgi:molybdopterin-guanine dinucleotide biosynthesis protein A